MLAREIVCQSYICRATILASAVLRQPLNCNKCSQLLGVSATTCCEKNTIVKFLFEKNTDLTNISSCIKP